VVMETPTRAGPEKVGSGRGRGVDLSVARDWGERWATVRDRMGTRLGVRVLQASNDFCGHIPGASHDVLSSHTSYFPRDRAR
jgi:hypothetical protein